MTLSWASVEWYIDSTDRLLIDTRLTLDQHSNQYVDHQSSEMSPNTVHQSAAPCKTHAPLLCILQFISVHPRSCIHVSQTSFCNIYMKPIKFKIIITFTLLLLFVYMFVYILISVLFVPLDNKVNNDTEIQGNGERDVDDSIRYGVQSCVYLYSFFEKGCWKKCAPDNPER